MNANLRVFVSIDACFSSIAVDYSVILEKAANVVSYAIIGREPKFLGVSSVSYKMACEHIERIINVFAKAEENIQFRSTTVCEAEVSWSYRMEREFRFARCSLFPEDMLAQHRRDSLPYFWAQEIQRLACSFLLNAYPQ